MLLKRSVVAHPSVEVTVLRLDRNRSRFALYFSSLVSVVSFNYGFLRQNHDITVIYNHGESAEPAFVDVKAVSNFEIGKFSDFDSICLGWYQLQSLSRFACSVGCVAVQEEL